MKLKELAFRYVAVTHPDLDMNRGHAKSVVAQAEQTLKTAPESVLHMIENLVLTQENPVAQSAT